MKATIPIKELKLPKDSASTRKVIWFSRLLRWGLGLFFAGAGIVYFDKGGWPAILFGAVLIATGFFRPRRCLEEGCDT